MTTDLFRIVYCSCNKLSEQQSNATADMASILAMSRLNNARDGVTGALLYSEGCFAQVLEGSLVAVQRTFERIQRDPRHGNVIVLEAGRVEARIFGIWDMALAETADPARANAILRRVLAEPDGNAGTTVMAMLDGLIRRGGDWAHAA